MNSICEPARVICCSNQFRCSLAGLRDESESNTSTKIFGPRVTEYQRKERTPLGAAALHQFTRQGLKSWSQPLNSWLPSAGNVGILACDHAAVSVVYVS